MTDGTRDTNCRLCDEDRGFGMTYTYFNGRAIHRKCVEELARLMPEWVTQNQRVPDTASAASSKQEGPDDG